MEEVPFTEEEIRKQCRAYLAKSKDLIRNFVVLRDQHGDSSFAVKIAYAYKDLFYDLAAMQYFKTPSSGRYIIPRGYGIVKDEVKHWEYLVMDNIQGKMIWEIMGNGTRPLTDEEADAIAAAVKDFRDENQSLCERLCKSDSLTPLHHWYPESPLFGKDNDGGRLLEGISDYEKFMAVRLEKAKIDPKLVPFQPRVITHGEISPYNLKMCPDGRIAILDLRTSFVAPVWWDYYIIHMGHYSRGFAEPLKRAFVRYGMGASDEILRELDFKFRHWFSRYGSVLASEEEENRLKGDRSLASEQPS